MTQRITDIKWTAASEKIVVQCMAPSVAVPQLHPYGFRDRDNMHRWMDFAQTTSPFANYEAWKNSVAAAVSETTERSYEKLQRQEYTDVGVERPGDYRSKYATRVSTETRHTELELFYRSKNQLTAADTKRISETLGLIRELKNTRPKETIADVQRFMRMYVPPVDSLLPQPGAPRGTLEQQNELLVPATRVYFARVESGTKPDARPALAFVHDVCTAAATADSRKAAESLLNTLVAARLLHHDKRLRAWAATTEMQDATTEVGTETRKFLTEKRADPATSSTAAAMNISESSLTLGLYPPSLFFGSCAFYTHIPRRTNTPLHREPVDDWGSDAARRDRYTVATTGDERVSNGFALYNFLRTMQLTSKASIALLSRAFDAYGAGAKSTLPESVDAEQYTKIDPSHRAEMERVYQHDAYLFLLHAIVFIELLTGLVHEEYLSGRLEKQKLFPARVARKVDKIASQHADPSVVFAALADTITDHLFSLGNDIDKSHDEGELWHYYGAIFPRLVVRLLNDRLADGNRELGMLLTQLEALFFTYATQIAVASAITKNARAVGRFADYIADAAAGVLAENMHLAAANMPDDVKATMRTAQLAARLKCSIVDNMQWVRFMGIDMATHKWFADDGSSGGGGDETAILRAIAETGVFPNLKHLLLDKTPTTTLVILAYLPFIGAIATRILRDYLAAQLERLFLAAQDTLGRIDKNEARDVLAAGMKAIKFGVLIEAMTEKDIDAGVKNNTLPAYSSVATKGDLLRMISIGDARRKKLRFDMHEVNAAMRTFGQQSAIDSSDDRVLNEHYFIKRLDLRLRRGEIVYMPPVPLRMYMSGRVKRTADKKPDINAIITQENVLVKLRVGASATVSVTSVTQDTNNKEAEVGYQSEFLNIARMLPLAKDDRRRRTLLQRITWILLSCQLRGVPMDEGFVASYPELCREIIARIKEETSDDTIVAAKFLANCTHKITGKNEANPQKQLAVTVYLVQDAYLHHTTPMRIFRGVTKDNGLHATLSRTAEAMSAYYNDYIFDAPPQESDTDIGRRSNDPSTLYPARPDEKSGVRSGILAGAADVENFHDRSSTGFASRFVGNRAEYLHKLARDTAPLTEAPVAWAEQILRAYVEHAADEDFICFVPAPLATEFSTTLMRHNNMRAIRIGAEAVLEKNQYVEDVDEGTGEKANARRALARDENENINVDQLRRAFQQATVSEVEFKMHGIRQLWGTSGTGLSQVAKSTRKEYIFSEDMRENLDTSLFNNFQWIIFYRMILPEQFNALMGHRQREHVESRMSKMITDHVGVATGTETLQQRLAAYLRVPASTLQQLLTVRSDTRNPEHRETPTYTTLLLALCLFFDTTAGRSLTLDPAQRGSLFLAALQEYIAKTHPTPFSLQVLVQEISTNAKRRRADVTRSDIELDILQKINLVVDQRGVEYSRRTFAFNIKEQKPIVRPPLAQKAPVPTKKRAAGSAPRAKDAPAPELPTAPTTVPVSGPRKRVATQRFAEYKKGEEDVERYETQLQANEGEEEEEEEEDEDFDPDAELEEEEEEEEYEEEEEEEEEEKTTRKKRGKKQQGKKKKIRMNNRESEGAPPIIDISAYDKAVLNVVPVAVHDGDWLQKTTGIVAESADVRGSIAAFGIAYDGLVNLAKRHSAIAAATTFMLPPLVHMRNARQWSVPRAAQTFIKDVIDTTAVSVAELVDTIHGTKFADAHMHDLTNKIVDAAMKEMSADGFPVTKWFSASRIALENTSKSDADLVAEELASYEPVVVDIAAADVAMGRDSSDYVTNPLFAHENHVSSLVRNVAGMRDVYRKLRTPRAHETRRDEAALPQDVDLEDLMQDSAVTSPVRVTSTKNTLLMRLMWPHIDEDASITTKPAAAFGSVEGTRKLLEIDDGTHTMTTSIQAMSRAMFVPISQESAIDNRATIYNRIKKIKSSINGFLKTYHTTKSGKTANASLLAMPQAPLFTLLSNRDKYGLRSYLAGLERPEFVKAIPVRHRTFPLQMLYALDFFSTTSEEVRRTFKNVLDAILYLYINTPYCTTADMKRLDVAKADIPMTELLHFVPDSMSKNMYASTTTTAALVALAKTKRLEIQTALQNVFKRVYGKLFFDKEYKPDSPVYTAQVFVRDVKVEAELDAAGELRIFKTGRRMLSNLRDLYPVVRKLWYWQSVSALSDTMAYSRATTDDFVCFCDSAVNRLELDYQHDITLTAQQRKALEDATYGIFADVTADDKKKSAKAAWAIIVEADFPVLSATVLTVDARTYKTMLEKFPQMAASYAQALDEIAGVEFQTQATALLTDLLGHEGLAKYKVMLLLCYLDSRAWAMIRQNKNNNPASGIFMRVLFMPEKEYNVHHLDRVLHRDNIFPDEKLEGIINAAFDEETKGLGFPNPAKARTLVNLVFSFMRIFPHTQSARALFPTTASVEDGRNIFQFMPSVMEDDFEPLVSKSGSGNVIEAMCVFAAELSLLVIFDAWKTSMTNPLRADSDLSIKHHEELRQLYRTHGTADINEALEKQKKEHESARPRYAFGAMLYDEEKWTKFIADLNAAPLGTWIYESRTYHDNKSIPRDSTVFALRDNAKVVLQYSHGSFFAPGKHIRLDAVAHIADTLNMRRIESLVNEGVYIENARAREIAEVSIGANEAKKKEMNSTAVDKATILKTNIINYGDLPDHTYLVYAPLAVGTAMCFAANRIQSLWRKLEPNSITLSVMTADSANIEEKLEMRSQTYAVQTSAVVMGKTIVPTDRHIRNHLAYIVYFLLGRGFVPVPWAAVDTPESRTFSTVEGLLTKGNVTTHIHSGSTLVPIDFFETDAEKVPSTFNPSTALVEYLQTHLLKDFSVFVRDMGIDTATLRSVDQINVLTGMEKLLPPKYQKSVIKFFTQFRQSDGAKLHTVANSSQDIQRSSASSGDDDGYNAYAVNVVHFVETNHVLLTVRDASQQLFHLGAS